MTVPCPYLVAGDTIGVFAPSSYVEQSDIEQSITVAQSQGFEIFVHAQTYARHGQIAGTTQERADAFHALWQREDIKAIWVAGGGNRALELLPLLDYDLIARNPKPLIGFSDCTILLNAIYARAELSSIHATVFKNLHKAREGDIQQLFSLLQGTSTSISLSGLSVLHEGTARGALIGGNLSMIMCTLPLLPTLSFEGKILILEDCAEEISHIDRMLGTLRHSGLLEKLSGLIFGEFTDLRDTGRPFGFNLDDVIAHATQGLDIPIWANAPFGHGQNMRALPIGQTVTMTNGALTLG